MRDGSGRIDAGLSGVDSKRSGAVKSGEERMAVYCGIRDAGPRRRAGGMLVEWT